ncbi:SART-1 family-domain-containing protein [Vararia minispora EC-137]|uniref:SART-1 family-domain-containing protein n=1 Tax=Vararia minispora EC-137 TaxID=1314806 RepID=A0ACB8QEI7_9AGAM|nr:SART-1 family-domain-containing protein [Vararia minispora EC-137]
MEESISLEETNKIRISLGLKPLTDDSKPADDKDKQAEDNYAKQREQEEHEKERKRIQDRIAKVRNRRELNASLKGVTLGDADADTDDTLKWLKKAKKREKELAKKRQQELENMDKVFQGDEYTEKDLEGLKVAHDLDQLAEGDARILTLKDSRILDNEGYNVYPLAIEDELQNVEMAEAERTKERNDLKIKKRDYTGYDDDEFVDGRAGMKRAVLSKYDEFLEGSKETGFRLGSSVPSTSKEAREDQDQVATAVKKSLLSIDYDKHFETSDYLQKGDASFKKSKTKKKRPARRVADQSDIPPPEDQMHVDIKPVAPRQRNLDANFVDDDDLQAELARARRAKIKAKKLTPEEIAKRIAEELPHSEHPGDDSIKIENDEAPEGGLVFDDTSEFVRAINYEPVTAKKEVREPTPTGQPSPEPMEEVEIEAGEVTVKDEEEEDENAMLNALENALIATEEEERKTGVDSTVGTAEEKTFNSGMAATVSILRQQGLLAAPTADQLERERVQTERDRWLAEQRVRVAQRELERLRSRGAPKDQAQREYENRLREQAEAREAAESFKDYKPDVKIEYHDEYGRTLTPKEAWKALSHRFHGKGSGKMKTEKRLKKIAEEKKKEAMASGDTPLSMSRAFQIRQEKTGQAHFVLSVGNRGAVPQAAEFLDPQPLSKGRQEKSSKGKKKEGSKVPPKQVLDGGFMTLPAPQVSHHSASASPAPGETGSPTPRPGFSRISTAATDITSPPGGGTPVPAERTKVAFGFGTKRKAGEEPNGTPPPKSARH